MRWSSLWFRSREEREMAEELANHIENRAADLASRGVPADEALRRARIEFGGVENYKERCREARGYRLFDELSQDLRYALRMMRRNPVVTAVAVVSLAIGIGANTAVYSMLNALLLRPLPVSNPERLVLLREASARGVGSSDWTIFSKLRDELAGTAPGRPFQGIAATRIPGAAGIAGPGGDLMPVVREDVSANYFDVLGVHTMEGSGFRAADDKIGAAPVAVVSELLWRMRFNARRDLVGSVLVVDERPTRIVGIAPATFTGMLAEATTDLWVNVASSDHPEQLTQRGYNFLRLFGRLSPGVSIREASAAAGAVFDLDQQPALARVPEERREVDRRHMTAVPGDTGLSMLRQLFELPLRIVMGVVTLLLLICCANIASLLLARTAARRREVATRISLGAGSARLVRQFLTESSLLAFVGGALGVLLAWAGDRAIVSLLPARGIPVALDVRPDWRVLLFTAALALGSVILFGLAPALRVRRLKLTTGADLSEHGGLKPGKLLAVAQVALSVVLIFAAGLFVRTLANLKHVDAGFRAEHVVTLNVSIPRAYSAERQSRITSGLMEALRANPGISAASASSGVFSQGGMDFDVQIGGKPHISYGKKTPRFLYIGPDFLSVLQAPLVAGREFTPADRDGTPLVAMINEAFAKAHFPGENPLGQQLFYRKQTVPTTIVGVVRDIRHWELRDKAPPAVYIPLAQRQLPWMPEFVLRTNLPVSQVGDTARRSAAAVDGQLRISRIQTLNQTVNDYLERERLLASLSSIFGVIALILATIGVYGVIAYGVTRRVSEIGLRIALGAARAQVLRMVLTEAAVIPLAGILVGAPLAYAASRVTASLLFGVQPGDISSLLGAAALILGMAMAAALIPAFRAMRIDPITVLRHE